MANTPLHSVRVDEDLWGAAKARAQSEGTTITNILVDALKRYTTVGDDTDLKTKIDDLQAAFGVRLFLTEDTHDGEAATMPRRAAR